MTVRGHNALLYRKTGNFAGTETFGTLPPPLFQQTASPVDLAHAQGQLDIREKMAELAETQQEIKHGYIENKRQYRMNVIQHEMQHQRQHGWRGHASDPGSHAVAIFTPIELPLEKVSVQGLQGSNARCRQCLELFENKDAK